MKAGYAFFLLVALASVGLFFTKGDLTGNVVFGDDVKPLCSSASDCQNTEACCFFYSESQGVCNSQSRCREIYDVTKAQSGAKAEFIAASRSRQEQDTLQGSKPGFELVLTLVTVALLAFLILRWSDSREKHTAN